MATILIVDDRPLNRQFLVTLLGYFDHKLLEASDGVEAMESLRGRAIDLVIADVLMPTLDGYDFLQRLRADPRFASTPVVFYTAAVYESKARAAAEAHGVRHFLTKPAEPEVILEAVNSALGLDPSPVALAPLSRFNRQLLVAPADPIDQDSVVFVVDDDSAVRKSMSMLITQAGLKVETFATAEEFLKTYSSTTPGCLVLDIRLAGMNGIELLETLRSRRNHIPTIILTGHGDTNTAVSAMRLRVLEFLEKPADSGILLAKIFQALQADSIQRREHAMTESIGKRMDMLTAREKTLVKLLIDGKSSKEIAADLQISVKTVSNHRANLMAKTHAINMADLVRMSMVALDR